MEGKDLIEAIDKAGLTGRGGAAFPTADKWRAVANALSEKKYVIANGAEGEPGSHKDYHILSHYPQDIIKGILLAINTVGALEGFLFLREDYYKRLAPKYRPLVRGLPIKIVASPGGYLCGEESTILNIIQGDRKEPRHKPPFPTQQGLWGCPTVVNNVETIRSVALISQNKYHKTRLYTLSGHIPHPGIFEAAENISIEDLLHTTRNEPKGKTFAQIGGGASGDIIPQSKYDIQIKGRSVVVIHTIKDIHPLLLQWSAFFKRESCGRCVPCREGTSRLYDALRQKKIDWMQIEEVLAILFDASFCPLGRSAANPFYSLFNTSLSPLKHRQEKS